MITDATVSFSAQQEPSPAHVKQQIARTLNVDEKRIFDLSLLKKSVDARRREVKIHYRYKVFIDEAAPVDSAFTPPWKQVSADSPAVHIVGAGPAGLFAALRLLESGVKPVIIEQGKRCDERRLTVTALMKGGTVDPHDNFCFGEGGAGAFSDGKLYSRSNKRGNIRKVLEILHYFGADPSILQDAHPHIGSDKLPAIITALTNRIVELGGEVHFGCALEAISTASARITGLRCRDVATNGVRDFDCDKVILATGQSADGVYRMISDITPTALQAKAFAAGVRVEHPRALIDAIQYQRGRETQGTEHLGAARYAVTTQVEGRGVYSFCMCPGGVIVPAASGAGALVVNGMSASTRNSQWSNAAIVAELKPGVDFADEPLAGLEYRRQIEGAAFAAANAGLTAPAQRLVDFLAGRASSSLPPASYVPGLVASRLDEWLPEALVAALKKAFWDFDRRSLRGFVCPEALLIAPETRSSAPVRILRNPDGESPVIAGLFPAGEGSGYSGGIVSSAMDGERIASEVMAASARF